MKDRAKRIEPPYVRRMALCTFAAVLLNACGNGTGKAPETENKAHETAKQDSSKTGQVVISAAEQTAQHIEIEPATVTRESNILRAPGRIVLPDNASWRVGVLVEGRIESVVAN